MTLREWARWIRHVPPSLGWFLAVLLLKPVVDAFWFLKDTGLLAPGQFLGVATTMLALIFLLLRPSLRDLVVHEQAFLGFGLLLVANTVIAFMMPPSVGGLGEMVRILQPVLIYFYLRRYVTNPTDFWGVVVTFLVSSIVPYSLIAYETVFGPIQVVELAASRGGGNRLTGPYADLFNYAGYIVGDFLAFGALYLRKLRLGGRVSWLSVFLVVSITLFGVINLRHQATWGVFGVVMCLTMLSLARTQAATVVGSLVLLAVIAAGPIWDNVVSPLYAKEINAASGQAETYRILNGRVVRWERYFTEWGEMSAVQLALGVGSSSSSVKRVMMSGGMHSDYVRLLFSTGIVGLALYLAFYAGLLIRARFLVPEYRFLAYAAAASMLLYSISSNPLGSSGALGFLLLLALTPCTASRDRTQDWGRE
ncbi:MAG: hypothetical protein ACI9BV_003796 [Rhodothermales bacterium]